MKKSSASGCSEDVQQILAVGVGVDVAEIGLEHLLAQLVCVGEIAVVAQTDTVGAVDVEGLGKG